MDEERTVYIIGAGFSHGYDEEIPLTNRLFQNLEDVYLSEEDMNLLVEMGRAFNSVEEIDIEEALAYCDIWQAGLFNVHLDDVELNPIKLSEILKRVLLDRLKHGCGKQNDAYIKWIKHLNQRDSIITFNYDWILEGLLKIYHEEDNHYTRLLQQLKMVDGLGYGKQPGFPIENGLLLKLHGSLNWWICSDRRCPNHQNIDIGLDIDEMMGQDLKAYEPEPFDICNNCSSKTEQLLIYPGIIKRYDQYLKIAHLWSIANTVLLYSKRIIVIGYSFRQQDFATSLLFRQSLGMYYQEKREWTIIDPDSTDIKDRLVKLLPSRENEIKNCDTYENLEKYMQDRSE